MSKYEDTYESEIECPYCSYQIPDSYELISIDDEATEIECDECSMKFIAECRVTVDYIGKPDCELNGEKHDYKLHLLRNGNSANFCETCGQIEPYKREANQ